MRLLKVPQPTLEHMKNDVTVYMRYYNLERLHTANDAVSYTHLTLPTIYSV